MTCSRRDHTPNDLLATSQRICSKPVVSWACATVIASKLSLSIRVMSGLAERRAAIINCVDGLLSDENGRQDSAVELLIGLYLCVCGCAPWVHMCIPVSEYALVSEWVCGWVSEGGVSEWVSEWEVDIVTASLIDCNSNRMSEWVSEWVSGWVREWMSEWVSEWVKEWVNYSFIQWLIVLLVIRLAGWLDVLLVRWLASCW